MAQSKSPAHVALGAAVRRLREQRGLSQEGLGQLVEMHRDYIGLVERAEVNVTFGSLVRLAEALGVRPSELVAQAERLAAGAST